MKNRVPEYKEPNTKEKSNKGVLFKPDANCDDYVVRGDNTIARMKWVDGKPIYVALTAVQLLETCRRWSKQNENYIEAPVIKNYNKYMEGIELRDRIICKYPKGERTGWVLYLDDAAKFGYQKVLDNHSHKC